MDNQKLKAIVESSLLKADHKFEFPPVCLQIAGQHGVQIFGTLGNFSTILAAPKVGKTTTTAVIVSALLTGNQISNFIPSLPEDKRVIIWVDTEQAKPECVNTIQLVSTQVLKEKTKHPDHLLFASLRNYSKDVRLEAIEYLLKITENVGFLVIDGIRDLVSSINDEKEATIIADKLLKWSNDFNIHILTILHQNKGDTNGRGHIGTELMNKAETVASLDRSENNGKRTTIIEPKLTRHKEFEPFAFTIENGLVSDAVVKQGYDPKNPTVEQLTNIEKETIIQSVFNNSPNLTYSKLWTGLKSALKGISIEFGDNKCKTLVIHLVKENYLIHDEQNKVYLPNLPV